MKTILVILLALLITTGYTHPLDYYNTPICGKFQNYYKTFPNMDALMMEIANTGKDWWLVQFSECQNSYSACPQIYQPICAYSNILNEFKTFSNACFLNAENAKTGIGWIEAFKFDCPMHIQKNPSYEPSISTTLEPMQKYTTVISDETTQEPINIGEETTTLGGNIIIPDEPYVTDEILYSKEQEEKTTTDEIPTTENTTVSTTPTINEVTEKEETITTDEITCAEETSTTTDATTSTINEVSEKEETISGNEKTSSEETSTYSIITEVSITTEQPIIIPGYQEEEVTNTPTTSLLYTNISSYSPAAIIPTGSEPSIRENQYNVYNGPYAERDFYHQPIHNYYNWGPQLPTSQPQPNPFYSINKPHHNAYYGSFAYGPYAFVIPVIPVNHLSIVNLSQLLNFIRLL